MSQRLERSVAHRVVWRGQRREVGPINGVPVMGVFTGQNPHFDVTATGIARFPIKSRHRPGRVPLQAIRAVLASSACAESVEEIKATHFHCVETCHPNQKPSNCACLQCSKLLLASCILVCPGNRSSEVFSFSHQPLLPQQDKRSGEGRAKGRVSVRPALSGLARAQALASSASPVEQTA
jgi:hypothetical protein